MEHADIINEFEALLMGPDAREIRDQLLVLIARYADVEES